MNRKVLLDIGAAGPLAGVLVSLPILLVGLALSDVVPATSTQETSLGNSLLFSLMNWIVHGPMPANQDIALHPIAFSGWIGLFVTSLNLLPVGQLDGGHIIYALFGSRQRLITKVALVSLVVLGITSWIGWLIWAVFLLFLGVNHPPVVNDWIPLDGKRRVIGWINLVVFAVTFMPAPF